MCVDSVQQLGVIVFLHSSENNSATKVTKSTPESKTSWRPWLSNGKSVNVVNDGRFHEFEPPPDELFLCKN